MRAEKIQDGLIVQVANFIKQYPNTTLIVIDTMQHIRNNGNDKNAYVSDYRDMDILRQITSHFNVALLFVTHTRKMDDPDPLNTISGSTGLVGAVNGVFILEKETRTANGGKLTITNRDTEGFVFLLEFNNNTCHWHYIDEETQQEKEEPLYLFIEKYLSERKSWKGTATELCTTLSKEYNELSCSPATISKKLRAGQNILKNKYGVLYVYAKKNNSKTIELTKI